jgi:uncharacterized protein YdeI (YjbR/CyaY-like superfamily)
MPNKAPPSDLPIHSFSSGNEFEAFLEREHKTAQGIYLKLAKKSAGIPSVSAAEAVETALCFGWIDGRANAFDDQWWLVRYTPRRSKSIWSQKNVNTIGRLLEQGRVRPAGVAAVEAAKADGRWERAYAGPATITVPDDLATALAADPAAASFFEDMNKTDRYAVLWRVQTASPQSRAKRIEALVQMLVEGRRPGATAELPAEPKKSADQMPAEGKRPGAAAKPAVKAKKSADKMLAENKRPGAAVKPAVKAKKSTDRMLAEGKRPGAPTKPAVVPKKSVGMKKANTSSVRSSYNLRTPRADATATKRPF